MLFFIKKFFFRFVRRGICYLSFVIFLNAVDLLNGKPYFGLTLILSFFLSAMESPPMSVGGGKNTAMNQPDAGDEEPQSKEEEIHCYRERGKAE